MTTLTKSVELCEVAKDAFVIYLQFIIDFRADLFIFPDRLCGLVVRVLGYRSGGPGSIPGTTKKK
jgi:hypothetical protein